MLNHVINQTATRENFEVYTTDLFRVTFIFPKLVAPDAILTEHVTKCTGWKDPGPDAIQTGFMQSKTNYASNAWDNTQEITMEFTLNLNKQLQNYVYKKIKEWRKLVGNPRTGAKHLKAEYVGEIIVEAATRDGQFVYKRTLKNAWPKGNIEGLWDYDYNSNDPIALSQLWVGDWDEEEER